MRNIYQELLDGIQDYDEYTPDFLPEEYKFKIIRDSFFVILVFPDKKIFFEQPEPMSTSLPEFRNKILSMNLSTYKESKYKNHIDVFLMLSK